MCGSRRRNNEGIIMGLRTILPAVAALAMAAPAVAQSDGAEVTFTRDIAPILQRSCQQCHRPDSVAPMSLITYEDVRPWARSIKARTGLANARGSMPPWFVERDLGIQQFKDDPSLSLDEIAMLATWVDSGAPQGNPADMPPPRDFTTVDAWTIGEPDLILSSPEVDVPATAPDKWTSLGLVPTGLTEDRYVAAVEVREFNDIPADAAGNTVGGRYVFHHMTYSSVANEGLDGRTSTRWPIHEVGRNADVFPPEAGRLLAAGSSLDLGTGHLHANGRDTTAHLKFAFKFHPRGYEPSVRRASTGLGNGVDIDLLPQQAGQELHAYNVLQQHTKIVAFEPHLHAPGVRMCIEAIWGHNIETLNCVGYDHNWVKQYIYDDDYAPLLPKGTILHMIGFLDSSEGNRNVADSRNWSGGGRRSVANMFIDLGQAVALTDEQFEAEIIRRREVLNLGANDHLIGCALCGVDFEAHQNLTADGDDEDGDDDGGQE